MAPDSKILNLKTTPILDLYMVVTMKKTILFFIVLFLMIGVCGCMKNQKEAARAEDMKNYAINKYGREFTVQNFQAAKDETYTNILSLSDGECIFNVYQSGDSEPSDDYPKAIVNKKLVDNLRSKIDNGCNIFASFMFANGSEITLEYAKYADISHILDDYLLLKVIVVVVVYERISEHAEELFNVYGETVAFNSKYIDFEVIQVESIGSGLEDMLGNLPAFYDNDWERYPEVIAYLGVTDTKVNSSDALIEGVR